ncbi:MAG: 7-cyano-7-deazaguanine synthase QueC [bacterium]
MENKKAVILLSGGLDSSTILYLAKSKGYLCFPLSFDYGQRHKKELVCARKIAESLGLSLIVVKINLPWLSSSLTDKKKPIPSPEKTEKIGERIPSTYVSARNLIFLSIAISYAEEIGANSIFIGANARDFSGYPDCRDDFLKSFFKTASLGTKAGVSKKPISIERPLIDKTKKEIVLLAKGLGVPFELTWSCYKGGRKPCGICESCFLRKKGFSNAGIIDSFKQQLISPRFGL